MNWLLRLFGSYRELEQLVQTLADEAEHRDVEIDALRESVADLTTEKLRLQDRLDGALSDRERVWDSFQAALRGERTAYQMQVNHAVQKAGGGVPYPDAHSLPPAAVPVRQAPGSVGRGSRMLFSEAASRHNRQFVEELISTP